MGASVEMAVKTERVACALVLLTLAGTAAGLSESVTDDVMPLGEEQLDAEASSGDEEAVADAKDDAEDPPAKSGGIARQFTKLQDSVTGTLADCEKKSKEAQEKLNAELKTVKESLKTEKENKEKLEKDLKTEKENKEKLEKDLKEARESL